MTPEQGHREANYARITTSDPHVVNALEKQVRDVIQGNFPG